MAVIPFAIQIPSLVDLCRKAKAQMPDASEEVRAAVATLAQAAYEDYYDWIALGGNPDAIVNPNHLRHSNVHGIAIAYLSSKYTVKD